MIKRVLIICVLFAVFYSGIIGFQVFWGTHFKKPVSTQGHSVPPPHKIYSFSFAKYTQAGDKEIEIEGDSANILEKTVTLMNVVAKAYAEESPVTITADHGNYDKEANKVSLDKNVVATTQNGTRLLTEELQIRPSQHVMETDVHAQVKKDNIQVEGIGAHGDSNLKKVQFKKNVTVVVQDPADQSAMPTIITCDGPLMVDYDKNVAHFRKNVLAQDHRGKLSSDTMDVYYDKGSRKISKMVATGNVVIENPDGNKTYSDNVVYLAAEGKVILGGDAEALYYEGDGKSLAS